MSNLSQLEQISKEQASAVASETAKEHGGHIPKGILASKLQSLAELEDLSIVENITPEDAARLISETTKARGGVLPKASLASKVQSIADKNQDVSHDTAIKPIPQRPEQTPKNEQYDPTTGKPFRAAHQEKVAQMQSEHAKNTQPETPKGSAVSMEQSHHDMAR